MQRRLAAEAPNWLVPHGKLLFETSDLQAEATAGILEDCGFAAVIESCEELDATVVVGTR
jgi:release factor glutamine methyltransferase